MDNYILALLHCKGVGTTKLYNYIKKNHFELEKIKNNIKDIIIENDYNMFDKYLIDAQNEINKNKNYGISIITILDERFPTKLYVGSDPVLYLYYRGNIDLLNKKSVAIIGTRKPNENAIKNTDRVTKEITKKGYVIVSGLALGIDSIGHKSCLEVGGKTIAVLPTSIGSIQPKSNKELAESIIEKNGCLITEYSVGSSVNSFNFAKRDRIQSLLSNCIVVPQADEKSGAMIAVKKSINENKPVFQFSTNNNSIIKETINIETEDYLSIISSSVENNYGKQINKDILKAEQIIEQTSLF